MYSWLATLPLWPSLQRCLERSDVCSTELHQGLCVLPSLGSFATGSHEAVLTGALRAPSGCWLSLVLYHICSYWCMSSRVSQDPIDACPCYAQERLLAFPTENDDSHF